MSCRLIISLIVLYKSVPLKVPFYKCQNSKNSQNETHYSARHYKKCNLLETSVYHDSGIGYVQIFVLFLSHKISLIVAVLLLLITRDHCKDKTCYCCPCKKLMILHFKTLLFYVIVCICDNPCTNSSCGRITYIYPEKNLRAYPGTLRGTEEWDATYKIKSFLTYCKLILTPYLQS